jgi:hypothetical protein
MCISSRGAAPGDYITPDFRFIYFLSAVMGQLLHRVVQACEVLELGRPTCVPTCIAVYAPFLCNRFLNISVSASLLSLYH